MGSQYTPEAVVDYYFCRTPDYCQGFTADQEWTVETWRANQGFDEYHQGRSAWLEIILRVGVAPPVRFDSRRQDLYVTCAYDLEGLRALLADAGFRRTCGLAGTAEDYLARPDQDLLAVSARCVQAVLADAGAERLDEYP
jgi:hypothetical protein